MYSYPSYRKFFAEIDGKSALCFWENYPSPTHIRNTTPEQVYKALKAINQGLKMERILEIIALIENDGDTLKDFQEERDFIVKSLVKSIRSNLDQIKEVDVELERIIPLAGYKLRTMPGIDLATEAYPISEIGDINRFPDSDKLARFMGLAPVSFSSAGKPRHPVFREYFELKVREGKNKPQALVCVARMLVRIIYGMMKTKTEYRPFEKNDGKN